MRTDARRRSWWPQDQQSTDSLRLQICRISIASCDNALKNCGDGADKVEGQEGSSRTVCPDGLGVMTLNHQSAFGLKREFLLDLLIRLLGSLLQSFCHQTRFAVLVGMHSPSSDDLGVIRELLDLFWGEKFNSSKLFQESHSFCMETSNFFLSS